MILQEIIFFFLVDLCPYIKTYKENYVIEIEKNINTYKKTYKHIKNTEKNIKQKTQSLNKKLKA